MRSGDADVIPVSVLASSVAPQKLLVSPFNGLSGPFLPWESPKSFLRQCRWQPLANISRNRTTWTTPMTFKPWLPRRRWDA